MPNNNEAAIALINRFPSPEPIDEIHIKRSSIAKEKSTAPKEAKDKATNWKAILIATLSVILFIILVVVLLPRFIHWYLKLRHNLASTTQQKGYWAYRSASFYVHQLGYFKEQKTALQHAQFIDKQFSTSFGSFMVVYLKMKYAKQTLSAQEEKVIQDFLPSFISELKSKTLAGYRFKAFFKVFRSIAFFGVGEE